MADIAGSIYLLSISGARIDTTFKIVLKVKFQRWSKEYRKQIISKLNDNYFKCIFNSLYDVVCYDS